MNDLEALKLIRARAVSSPGLPDSLYEFLQAQQAVDTMIIRVENAMAQTDGDFNMAKGCLKEAGFYILDWVHFEDVIGEIEGQDGPECSEESARLVCEALVKEDRSDFELNIKHENMCDMITQFDLFEEDGGDPDE